MIIICLDLFCKGKNVGSPEGEHWNNQVDIAFRKNPEGILSIVCLNE